MRTIKIEGTEYTTEKQAFAGPTEPDRGYTLEAWFLKEPHARDAAILILKDGTVIRKFLFPAYKIWNIAAHFRDIVDSEIAGDVHGHNLAGSDGLGGGIRFTKT